MPVDSDKGSVAGLIERVTFFNEETGFAVLRVKVRGRTEMVTVVGSVPSVSAGEWLNAEGNWVRDNNHGLQLKAEHIRCSPPTTKEGIEKYLGSGMVRGIGPVYAKKLVDAFGEKIFEIIDQYSARLEEIDGIGPERRKRIKDAWAEQKFVREIMVFLHSHGVSTGRAVRIYKTYGEKAIEQVRADPYCLARDIHGIGFQSADQIARKIGIAVDSPERIRAGLQHVLDSALGQGHCALPRETLVSECQRLLDVSEAKVSEVFAKEIQARDLVEESIGEDSLVFLPRLQRAEEAVTETLSRLAGGPPTYPPIEIEKALEWSEQKTGKQWAPTQREAVRRALTSKALVITGGPGTGKTTLLQGILMILRAKKVQCALCAPTGRAAKRLSEATGLEAKTIHRLLEPKHGGFGFTRNASTPLDCDLLVVDESSMIDIQLMQALLRALPGRASLILVGDIDQLPSVGPGNVLRDIIDSTIIPVLRLTEVFRQAAKSQIITTAHEVNAGRMPATQSKDAISDFYFVPRMTPEETLHTLIDMVKTRIPQKFRLNATKDVQVLTPMNRGELGVRNLNTVLQEALNPIGFGEPTIQKFGTQFRLRDKVIQLENDYDREVFNGDIGLVSKIDEADQIVMVDFEGRAVRYTFGELDELALAYAISIHKSQGSEFPCVVVPVSTQHFMLLQRNLIYTAITRGKKLVTLIGEAKALQMAVRNNESARRHSGLLARLKAAQRQ